MASARTVAVRPQHHLRTRIRWIVLLSAACAAAWLLAIGYLGVWRLEQTTQRSVDAAAEQAAAIADSGAQVLGRRLEAMRTIGDLLAGQERFAKTLTAFDDQASTLPLSETSGLVALRELRLLSLDLSQMAQRLNLEGVLLVSNEGLVVAGSDGGQFESHIGNWLAEIEFLDRSRILGHAEDFRVDPITGAPTYYFANRIEQDGTVLGQVLIATTSERLLQLLERGTESVLLSDRNNIVMVAREPELLYRSVGPVDPLLGSTRTYQLQYGRSQFEPLPDAYLAEEVDDVRAAGAVHASVVMTNGPFTVHVVREIDDLWQDRRENLIATAGLALFGLLLTALVAFALAQIAALRERATRDPLTGLSNRRHADEVLPGLFELDERGRLAGLVMVAFDLDHFKKINDGWGHDTGDRVLRRFAQILERSARRTDLLFRFGGEEFIAILVEQDIAAAMAFAERVRSATQALDDMAPVPAHGITVSAGLALRQKDETTEALLARADALLYRAKANGRNRIEVDPA